MIRWLHISDLHHGQSGHGGRWPQLRERALADLRAQVAERGRPDLLLFTGDLAFSGQDEEYAAVEATLADIRAALGCDPLVLPVPGNHDLRRPAGRWPLTELGLANYNTLKRHVLSDNQEIHDALARIFSGYTNWFRAHVEPQWVARRIRYHIGLFPGDFRLALSVGGFDLAVVGINSAVCHHDDKDNPNLVLEVEQCGPEFERWVEKHEAALLLMHHPENWLPRQVQPTLTNRIYTKDRFVACLFGHMHEAAVDTDGARRRLQASSLFGLEHYGSNSEFRISGYAWGALERVDATRARLFQWARRFTESGVFVADPAASLESGIDVLIRPIPQPDDRPRVAVVANDARFRKLLATEIDTYSDVSEVIEAHPADVSLDDGAGAPRVVVLLTSTTVPTPLLERCLSPASLILRAPFNPEGDPDVLRDSLLLQQRYPLAQSCRDAREAASAVRAWLNISRRQMLATAAPVQVPAVVDASTDDLRSPSWVDVDSLNQSAKAHFDEGQFAAAAANYRAIAAKLVAIDETVPGRTERLAKARLNIAACALSLDLLIDAESELASVKADILSSADRVRLIMLWAALGRVDLARAMVPLLEANDASLVEQRLALREGKLPEALDPSLRLEACEVLIAQGRIAEAAETAMIELDGAAG